MRMIDNGLGQRIADCVVGEFNQVRGGKSTRRSNGVEEWTVLAGIVLIDGDELIPVAVSTGVKALPDQVRTYLQGLIVHDMHAEILCMRAFNLFLVHEALNGDSKYLEKTSKYELKSGVKIALYVSEPPCGDASMEYLKSQSQDSEPWKQETGENAVKKRKVVRGRSHFDQLGIIRTKPGRLDLIETLSKSCSDKLCVKQVVGMNNSITSAFVEPVFLDYLVLPQSKFLQQDIDRCFYERFPLESAHRIQVLGYESDDYAFHKKDGAVPSPLSLVHLCWNNDTQVLLNGMKNGAFVKKKPPKRGGESILCNKAMWKASSLLLDTDAKTYSEFKQQQHERNATKEEARKILGKWECTGEDNFEIALE